MAKNLLVSAFLLLSISAEAGELVPPPDVEGYLSNPEASAEYASTVLHTLNELSARRRLTMLFINEQSPFYGVQMNYVNVGRGNLTFLVRDIVRLDRIPIVFGRVYDSSKQDESDFGPGWKLSVAESLRLTDRRLLYVDASNSEYELDVDGARISSVHPHLTGIRGGRFDGTGLVLETGDLVKTFYRHGDGFRLAEVRNHSDGWISFSYSGDVIERISSSGGRHVDIQRDATGRIVAAVDDAGRRVAYAYDSSGRLSESHDLAGEAYRYSYDAKGFLSELIDPRSERNVAARFDEVGRVIELTSQHDAMSYRYEAGSTLATNALQQAARFWHHGAGLTQSIQDFAGGVSALELDAELHATQFTFDGVAVARAAHAGDRLSAVIESNGSSFETRRFAYDARGRLIRIGEAGEPLARYGYDDKGNVTFAEDASGKRRYSYRLDGSLVGAEIDGFRLGIETNQIGLVEHVRWVSGSAPSHEHGLANARNGERQEQEAIPLSLDISYNDADRVEALRFNTPNGSLASSFRYTSRGFRSGGRYDVLERIGQGEITLSYDPVGNLTEWTLPAPYRKSYLTHHTVGPRNQVMAVTPIGQEELEQTFEYDANGRPVRVFQGGRREVVLRYDELSRLTDVHLDGEHVLTARHGPMDVDPVHEADAHTPFTAVDQPVASAVFGSLEEIAFTRIEGTPYGFVRFVPTMARFVIRDPLIAPPDAVVLASLKRRNLASRATLTAEPIQGFDKPSNSLFIPPEYFAVNCWYCVAGASGFDLDRVGSGPVAVGQTVNFVADADYSVCYSYESWWPEIPEIWYYEGGWNHRILVNGAYVTQFPGPTLGWENHEYLEFGLPLTTLGQNTVSDELRCSCSNMFMVEAEEPVEVCDVSQFEANKNRFTGPRSTAIARYQPQDHGSYFSFAMSVFWDSLTESQIDGGFAFWNDVEDTGSCGYYDVSASWTPSLELEDGDIIFAAVSGLGPCGNFNPTDPEAEVITVPTNPGGSCGPVPEILAHEIGHALGFPNSLNVDPTDIMNSPRGDPRKIKDYHAQVLLYYY